MSASCCCACADRAPPHDPRYRRALWVALVASLAMLVAESAASWAWPDLLVAGVMGALALSGACSVLRQARTELAQAVALRG